MAQRLIRGSVVLALGTLLLGGCKAKQDLLTGLKAAIGAGATSPSSDPSLDSNSVKPPNSGGSGSGEVASPSRPVSSLNVVNYRTCFPPQTGMGTSAVPAIPVQVPAVKEDVVLRIASIEADREVHAYFGGCYIRQIPRKVLFEAQIAKNASGSFVLPGQQQFQLQLPDEVRKAIQSEKLAGRSVVASYEERLSAMNFGTCYQDSYLLYGSSSVMSNGGSGMSVPTLNMSAGLMAAVTSSTVSFQIGVNIQQTPTTSSLNGGERQFAGEGEQPGEGKEPPCDRTQDPLVIDFAGRGLKGRTLGPQVFFDLANLGTPQRMGWLAPQWQAEIGFLVLPEDGQVHTGAQMFSNFMEVAPGVFPLNGFEALRSFDKLDRGGNLDRQISAKDPIFGRIQVWFDLNSNAQVDSGELKSLASLGVTNLELDYDATVEPLEFGNSIFGRGRARTSFGAVLDVLDLWLVHN